MKPFFLFSKETKGEGYVPNNEIFAYASGLAGQNLTYSYVSGWLRYFCINLLHMDPVKVGSVFTLSHVWDAINDPVIGAIVDRRNHKPYMKLRPYHIYFPPILGLISLAMFFNFNFSENMQVAYILITYFMFDFFYSFQDVALWGLIPLSSPHSDERSRVAQWVSIGAGAGSVVVGAFQMIRSALNSAGLDDKTVFFLCAILFCCGGELLSMNAYRMKERVAMPPEKGESVLQSLLVLRHNPTLLLISAARFSQGLSPKVQNAYFFENCVNFGSVNGQTLEVIYGAASGVLGTPVMFFATSVAKKIGGMKKILVLSQLFAVVLRIAAFFVGFNTIPKFIIMTALMAVVNLPGQMMDIAHRSLTADSIDEVELKTGLRTEGVSFSMQNFTTKMQSGASTLIEGFLLKFLGYDSLRKEQGLPQSEKFIKWQWPMFMLGPVVGAVLYLILISFVKDNKERKLEIERQLRERRQLNQSEDEPVQVNTGE
ncbi:MAG: MFS transporter [Clostridia bacterium]|nr:MFS transporter [Clostridia bacterium]